MKKIIIVTLGMLFAIFLGWRVAHCETSAYVTLNSSGAGYDAGIGIRVSHLHRFNDLFAVKIGGSYALQHKTGAKDGYTYGLSGSLRFYPREKWYLSGGYGVSGYETNFADGRTWKKHGWSPRLGLGYDSDRFDAWLSYSFEESDSPNEVSSASVGIAYKPIPDSGFKVRFGLTRMWFVQSGRDMTETLGTMGVGWEF